MTDRISNFSRPARYPHNSARASRRRASSAAWVSRRKYLPLLPPVPRSRRSEALFFSVCGKALFFCEMYPLLGEARWQSHNFFVQTRSTFFFPGHVHLSSPLLPPLLLCLSTMPRLAVLCRLRGRGFQRVELEMPLDPRLWSAVLAVSNFALLNKPRNLCPRRTGGKR